MFDMIVNDVLPILYGRVLPFIVVVGIIVFVHEMGHYLCARWLGMRVESFSLGMGREIVGFNDRHGTRWKISLLPIGGFVKLFGDADPSSLRSNHDTAEPPEAAEAALSQEDRGAAPLTEAEKAVAFHYRPLWQRAIVIAGGPLANFIFAAVTLFAVFATVGDPYSPPVVGQILDKSPAAEVGLKPGDRITQIGATPMVEFGDITRTGASFVAGHPLKVFVTRGDEQLIFEITPRTLEGDVSQTPKLGVGPSAMQEYREMSVGDAAILGVTRTGDFIYRTFQALFDMVAGKADLKNLGGPLAIGDFSGRAIETQGLFGLVWVLVLISVSIGALNLLPIPLLDGGHLLLYAVQAVRGRPLSERSQEWAFKVGMGCVLLMVAVAFTNDIRKYILNL